MFLIHSHTPHHPHSLHMAVISPNYPLEGVLLKSHYVHGGTSFGQDLCPILGFDEYIMQQYGCFEKKWNLVKK